MSRNAVLRVLIGTDTSVAAATGPNNIPTGGVVVFDKNFAVLGAGATIADTDTIYIAQGTANGPLISPPIVGAGVRSYLGESFVTPVDQVIAVGFNGTDGDITVDNDIEYQVNIKTKHEKDVYQSARRYSYISDATATRLEIAAAFVQQINADTDSDVEATILSNGVFTVLGAASTLTVTNGSVTATASAAGHAL